MPGALKRAQPGQALLAQPVLGQHAADGLAQDLGAAPLLHEDVHGDLLEGAGAGVVSVVELAPLLVAGGVEGGAVGHDDVVAAVGRGVPDGLVLAHEQDGDARGEAAQRRRRHVGGGGLDGAEGLVGGRGGDMVPYTGVGQSGLYRRGEREKEEGDFLSDSVCVSLGFMVAKRTDIPARLFGTLLRSALRGVRSPHPTLLSTVLVAQDKKESFSRVGWVESVLACLVCVVVADRC